MPRTRVMAVAEQILRAGPFRLIAPHPLNGSGLDPCCNLRDWSFMRRRCTAGSSRRRDICTVHRLVAAAAQRIGTPLVRRQLLFDLRCPGRMVPCMEMGWARYWERDSVKHASQRPRCSGTHPKHRKRAAGCARRRRRFRSRRVCCRRWSPTSHRAAGFRLRCTRLPAQARARASLACFGRSSPGPHWCHEMRRTALYGLKPPACRRRHHQRKADLDTQLRRHGLIGLPVIRGIL